MAGSAHERALRAMLRKVVCLFRLGIEHSAQYADVFLLVFTCVAALAVLDRLDEVDQDTLGWWLAERQLPNGGLNGRPEKLEDVCYSFWVLSALSILNKMTWINADKLTSFILSAQVRQLSGDETSRLISW